MTRLSKSLRKNQRIREFNKMTLEEQAENRFNFYSQQSHLPKYQRKLANFGHVWDQKLQDSMREMPEYKDFDRPTALAYLTQTGDHLPFIIRPSSMEGFLSVSLILPSGKFENYLLAYRNGTLCTFSCFSGGAPCFSHSYSSKENMLESFQKLIAH